MIVRCSSLGKLMTEPRSKSEVLSQTAKSYIEDLFNELEFGYRKEFSWYSFSGVSMYLCFAIVRFFLVFLVTHFLKYFLWYFVEFYFLVIGIKYAVR